MRAMRKLFFAHMQKSESAQLQLYHLILTMDCFFCDCVDGDVPSGEFVMIYSTDGYSMRAPTNAQITVVADGAFAKKPIAQLKPGDQLVLNAAPDDGKDQSPMHARTWLLGTMLAISQYTAEVSERVIVPVLATPNMELVREILNHAKCAKCDGGSVIINTTSEGVYTIQGPEFARLAIAYSLGYGLSDVACAKIAAISREFQPDFIAGFYKGCGSKAKSGAISMHAISRDFAVIIMRMLLKFGIRARCKDNEINIESRADLRVFSELMHKSSAMVKAKPAATIVTALSSGLFTLGGESPMPSVPSFGEVHHAKRPYGTARARDTATHTNRFGASAPAAAASPPQGLFAAATAAPPPEIFGASAMAPHQQFEAITSPFAMMERVI